MEENVSETEEKISDLFIIRRVTLANVNVEAGSNNFCFPYAQGDLNTPDGYELMSLFGTHNSDRTYCSVVACIGNNGIGLSILNRTGANLGGVNLGYVATFVKNGYTK